MSISKSKNSFLTNFIYVVQFVISWIIGAFTMSAIADVVIVGIMTMVAGTPGLILAIAGVLGLYWFSGVYEKVHGAFQAIGAWVFKPLTNWAHRRDAKKAEVAAAKTLAEALAESASGVVAEVMAESQVNDSEILRDAVATRGASIVAEGMSNVRDILGGANNPGLTPA